MDCGRAGPNINSKALKLFLELSIFCILQYTHYILLRSAGLSKCLQRRR